MDDAAARLEEKRRKLEADIARISAPPAETGAISFGKRVGEGTSLAVERLADVATYDKAQRVLSDVKRAQAKLEEGSYGICDRCGDPILPDRQEALPWAVVCVGCAAK